MKDKLTYTAQDIAKILQVSVTRGYSYLKKLQKDFKIENPNCYQIKRCIPVWYFNQKILGIKKEEHRKSSLK